MNGAEFLESKGFRKSLMMPYKQVSELLDEFGKIKQDTKRYVIISLKHTSEKDLYVTFWRPDDAGYCWALDDAGIYENPEKGYHINEENKAVEYDKVLELCVTVSKEKMHRKTDGKFLPNNSTILRRLGINI